jgi:hypothetical protein
LTPVCVKGIYSHDVCHIARCRGGVIDPSDHAGAISTGSGGSFWLLLSVTFFGAERVTEDQKRDEVMAIVREGQQLGASDAETARAIAYWFALNGFEAPKSLVAWMGASGRWISPITRH